MNIIDFCNANNILWQPINLAIKDGKKKPGKIAGYMPKPNDFSTPGIGPEVIKNRQININLTDYIAIYTNDVQQIDIDEDLGAFKFKSPSFESVTKKLPHYFVKFNQDKTSAKKLSGADLLSNNWSYCRKDQVVVGAKLPIPVVDYNKLIEKDANFKEIYNVCQELYKIPIDYHTWFHIICGIYNYSTEHDLDALKIVHNFSRNHPSGGYDENAKKTIDKLPEKSYAYNIQFLKKLIKDRGTVLKTEKCLFEDDDDNDDDSELEKIKNIELYPNPKIDQGSTDIVFFEKKINKSYRQFKTEWENHAFYCISINKIVFTIFDDYLLFSEIYPNTVRHVVGQTKEYGNLTRYGEMILPEGKKKPLWIWHLDNWLTEEMSKKQHFNYDFLPEPYKIESNTYNIWQGYDLSKNTALIDEVVSLKAIGIFTKFINHVGKSHPDLPEFLTQYIANIVQNPGTKEGILLVLTGSEGTFKGTFYRLMKAILGRKYCIEVSDADKVIGRFNAGLMKKLFCCLNEAVSFEMIQKSGVIKGLVTDTALCYEQKGMPIIDGHNFTRIMICTNEQIGAKSTRDDRRNVHIETSKMPDTLRLEINELIDSEEMILALFRMLGKIEIKYKNMKQWQDARPITAKHHEIIDHFTDITYLFINGLLNGSSNVENDNERLILSSDLTADYDHFMTKYPKIPKKTPRQFLLFMTKLGDDSKAIRRFQDADKKRGFGIKCRLLRSYLVDNGFVQAEEKLETLNIVLTKTDKCLFEED